MARCARISLGVVAGAAMLATLGCDDPAPATVVALPGCGLDEDLTGLRVRVRGDFPPNDGTEIVIAEGDGELPSLPAGAGGITVEGEVGDFVAAVGRTARIARAGAMPVYFAPPDSMCPVPSGLAPRDIGAAAVGPHGDVLMAGGRLPDGSLTGELIHFVDSEDDAVVLEATLPIPSTGQTVHAIGDHQFVVVGGAGPVGPVRSMVVVDLDAPATRDPVGDPILINVGGEKQGRAFHASAELPDGRIMVVGGCLDVVDGLCQDGSAVLSSSFVLDPVDLELRAGKNLGVARHSAQLHVLGDGVQYVVGGFDGDGEPVRVIERRAPGMDFARWAELPRTCPGGAAMDLPLGHPIGSAVLDGELVIVATADGRVVRGDDPCGGSLAPGLPPATRRAMTRLSGERVLMDAYIVSPFAAGTVDRVDLSDVVTAPGQRVGATVVKLGDGTALLAGGRDPSDESFVTPMLARVRPDLDGPDEAIPAVGRLTPSSLLVSSASTVSIAGDRLTLSGAGEPSRLPVAWARARGFRSTTFRFEATVEAEAGARPHVVLQRGGLWTVSVRFDSGRVRAFERTASNAIEERSCQSSGGAPSSADVRIDVTPAEIAVFVDDDRVATCEGVGDHPVAVGLGASGGAITATRLRLARI